MQCKGFVAFLRERCWLGVELHVSPPPNAAVAEPDVLHVLVAVFPASPW
jgi:hypothetical protein